MFIGTHCIKTGFKAANSIYLSNSNPSSCVKNLEQHMIRIIIIILILKVNAFFVIKNSRLRKTLCNLEPSFSWVLQVQDILGRWKLVSMMKTCAHQGTLQFFRNDVYGHFKAWIIERGYSWVWEFHVRLGKFIMKLFWALKLNIGIYNGKIVVKFEKVMCSYRREGGLCSLALNL